MSLKISRFPVFKLTATGNDFLLIDLLKPTLRAAWKKEWGSKPRADRVRQWCHRQEGLGADGMVFLEPDKSFDFAWDFYNSDGSSAEMCGNAARAVSLYASQVLKKKKLSFRSAVGPVEAKVHSQKKIEVRLSAIAENHWNQLIDWKGSQLNYDFVRAGVPHAVVRVPNLDDRSSLHQFALQIKNQPQFIKDGTNVTFVRLLNQNKIASITFERGVEDFTLSCGTGAISSAHSVLRGEENRPIEVQVPGGTLFVVWKNGCPILSGPARIVAEMHLCR